MKWQDYYEKISDWDISTAVNQISSLEDMGKPDEIVEAIYIIETEDEKGATRLLNRALQHGVKFSGMNLVEMEGICEEESFKKALYQSADRFTTQDLEDLYCCIDDELIIDVAKKYGISVPADIAEEYGDELYGVIDEDDIVEVARRKNLKFPKDLRETLQEDAPEDEATEVADFQWEIQSAMEAADYALECLYEAKEAMNNSSNVSFIDMVNKGLLASLWKYSALSDADDVLENAQNALQSLNAELRTLLRNKSVRLKYGKLASIIDVWVDSDFMDCLLYMQINKAHKQIKRAIRQVETIKKKLERL